MHIEKVCQVQNMPSPIKHIKYGLESFNKSHGRQKYVQKSKPVSCFFKPAQSTSKKKQLVLLVKQSDEILAAICSVFHAVRKNFSLNSCMVYYIRKCSLIAKLLNRTRWKEQNLVMLSILVLHFTYIEF